MGKWERGNGEKGKRGKGKRGKGKRAFSPFPFYISQYRSSTINPTISTAAMTSGKMKSPR
jgi:hypothetical protein